MTSRHSNWRLDKNSEPSGSKPYNRPKRPPGLRGRAIGLWYRDQMAKKRLDQSSLEVENEDFSSSRARAKEAKLQRKKSFEKLKDEKPLGSILLSDQKKKNINILLNETLDMYPSLQSKNITSYEHLSDTEFKHEFLQHIRGNMMENLKRKCQISKYDNEAENERFLDELKDKKKKHAYKQMQNVRNILPSMKMKKEIIDLIHNNQITVISGETGCGKTTQVAQFILDDLIEKGQGSQCKIICTQPRRISAISVAERVAAERDENIGGSVGFQIRLEKVMPRNRGSILFCTTGVLLKRMETDPSLNEISHIILDEIHERDIISDFLITVLKDVIQFRKDIKIILMSATLNSEAFSKYYNEAPHINIPGFTYPVQEYFLEDVLQMTNFKFEDNRPIWRKKMSVGRKREWHEFIEPYIRQLEAEKKYSRHVTNELRNLEYERVDINLIFELLLKLCFSQKNNDDGAILIFVPGLADIQKLSKLMKESEKFPMSKFIIIPLHSQLPTMDQKQIFKPAPKGTKKIIIATNIAETSITIDDVTTVIDCGFIKISNVDTETGIETLNAEMVSQANAAQRKGRAGRVKPGICYHLITKIRYDLLDKFLKPEVLRKRLEDVILQLKMLQLGKAESFLSKLMDPPESKLVQVSLNLLQRLGALNSEENLTPLGYHMAKLPVPAQCSKMLILASLFSCVDPILSIAASLGFKEANQLSVSQDDSDKRKYQLSMGTKSDHIAMHYALRGYEDAEYKYGFCKEFFLSSSILRLLIEMRKQFAQHLFDMKFTSSSHPRSPSDNLNSDNVALIKAIISAGLYPNVAVVTGCKRVPKLRSVSHEKMEFHPKSVLSKEKSFSSPLIVYHTRIKSSSLYIHDGTIVFPLSLVFFGDQFRIHEKTSNDRFSGVSINGTMRFVCTQSTASAIQNLRDRLNQILEWKVSHPGQVSWAEDNPELRILKTIMELITMEDNEDLDLSDYDDN
ncbi:hypothetical protein ABEB36_009813 [Hypothenemus hampei]|uniref:RNA helicase n=1 Tax=Hypothenemus hampei TaxID=57062 RepID=A0ABD1EHL2_HYPHA